MKNAKFWIAVLVSGVAANIIDAIVFGLIVTPAYFAKLPDLFNQNISPVWFIILDFIWIFIFACVYDKVYNSFSGGVKGGMMWGLYGGIFCTFPTWISLHLMFKGFPYDLSWIFTIYMIIWYVINGAIIGAIYKKSGSPQTA